METSTLSYYLMRPALKGIYFPRGNLWNAKKGSRPSWRWQSLIMGRDTMSFEVKWVVGNRESIDLREDKWLEFGVIEGPANQENPQRVADLIDQGLNTWKEHKLQELFEENIVKEILAIPRDVCE